jgi:DinB superfamily
MFRPAAILAALLLLAPAAPFAQEMSKPERDQVVKYLTSMRDQVVSESEKLTDAQWNFKSAPDRWSVGEVVEHLALAESFLFDLQQKTVGGPEAPADKRAETKGKDEVIIKVLPDRTKRAQAPEPLQPGARLGSRAEVLAAFKERRAKTIAYASTTKDNLRSRVSDSPLGPVDAYQWLLFAAAHSERHLAQLREVKADPNFPRTSR